MQNICQSQNEKMNIESLLLKFSCDVYRYAYFSIFAFIELTMRNELNVIYFRKNFSA